MSKVIARERLWLACPYCVRAVVCPECVPRVLALRACQEGATGFRAPSGCSECVSISVTPQIWLPGPTEVEEQVCVTPNLWRCRPHFGPAWPMAGRPSAEVDCFSTTVGFVVMAQRARPPPLARAGFHPGSSGRSGFATAPRYVPQFMFRNEVCANARNDCRFLHRGGRWTLGSHFKMARESLPAAIIRVVGQNVASVSWPKLTNWPTFKDSVAASALHRRSM